jgi:hypothetical protein
LRKPSNRLEKHLAEQRFQVVERDLAHFAVFQRHRIALVALAADGVHAEQFTGHLEARDLLLAGGVHPAGLEMTVAHRVQVAEGFVQRVQALVAREAPAAADDPVETVDVDGVEPHRQAQLVHAAGAAAGLDGAEADRRRGGKWGALAHRNEDGLVSPIIDGPACNSRRRGSTVRLARLDNEAKSIPASV